MPYRSGDKLLDKYRVEELVGRGAFGEVYRVTHIKLNTPRALKVLSKDSPGLGSTQYGEYQDRFKLEAQLGAGLNHPNIIQVHDFEMAGEDLILVMEYAAGGNLSKRIEQAKQGGKPMPLGTSLAIAQEVAEGLAKLHELDVVHRDLKPSNILFDEKGHAKVADLGLAQVPGGLSMRSQLSVPALHPGTPAYMSPEQENTGKYLTPASDVYALGSVLFEMLTGRVYRSQRPGTRVGSLREDVPAWLDDLLAGMLSEAPDKRPWDGRELAGLLRAGLQKEGEQQESKQAQQKAEEDAQQAALEKARKEEAERKQQEVQQRAAEIARLREAAQSAIQRGDWNRAGQAMEDLGKFGKDGQAEAAKLQERMTQAQREQDDKNRREKEQRNMEIARLTRETETALARKDWESAKRTLRQLEGLGPEGQAVASRLQKNIPSWWKAIPGWVKATAVGGLAVLGMVILGVVVVIGQISGTPTPAIPDIAAQASSVTEAPAEVAAFTTPHPILGDLRVRRAIAYCTNRIDLIKSVYPLLSAQQQQGLIMSTFIPKSHWAYAGDENVTIYPFDPEQGKALLEEAGWTLQEGYDFRTNANGEELSLKFTTTSATFRQTWAAVWESQMAECGIRIVRLHASASWWFGDTTGIARRDYELGAFAWVGQADPGGQTLYACDQIPLPGNGWVGQNAMGWCNEAASTAIKKANNTLVKQERIDNYRIVQQEFTRDVPSIPLFNRTETYAVSADIRGFQPEPGQEYYNYNVQDWYKAGSDTIVLGFTQEPASLFALVEDAFVANIAYQIVRPAQETHLNYEFKASLVKQLPTLENGGTTYNDVEVTEGTMVVDADGKVAALATGVKVFNAAGESVEFTGGTITMKQLVSRFEIINGLTWEDGTPVSSADIELNKKITCDPASGAYSFYTCDKTASTEFLTNTAGYIQTWLPGVQDPLYYVPVWGLYPAHQVIADGRRLADIPAAEWATLPEVAERPLSYGPYKLDQWVRGEKLVYSVNPYWVGSAPRSPYFVIQFIASESAEAALLSGQIDILASESLAGLSDALAAAETEGTIVTYVIPGGTWEHIDIALFIP